jgi:hypothetical protein
MSCYTIDKSAENIVLVSLKSIELQSFMVKILENKGIDLTDYTKMDRCETFSLSRLESMEEAMDNNTPLPPVMLQLHAGRPEQVLNPLPSLLARGAKPRIIPATPETFSVENGRHRIVMSILKGYTHIPAIIE